jgi:hypothetical protein
VYGDWKIVRAVSGSKSSAENAIVLPYLYTVVVKYNRKFC